MNGMVAKISANRSQAELHSTTSMRSQSFDYRHRLALARIAIRLHRYCAENGVFPKDLAEIVDTSLPNLPINLLDDQPVLYQSTATGCGIALESNTSTDSETISVTIPMKKT